MLNLYIYLQQRQNIRRERLLRDRLNPLEFYDNLEFRNLFRFNKDHVQDLTQALLPHIDYETGKNSALPPIHQVCIGLRFLATGCFQLTLGSWINVDQSTVSRTSWRVIQAILNSFPDIFTLNVQTIKEGFFDKYGIPNIVGAIDCTHIRIRAPPQRYYPEVYINRKNFHSFNVQAACNSDCVFTDVVAAWPGSVHDSRIFKNSDIYNNISSGRMDGILLGDNGYSLTPFLLTPFLNPDSQEKDHYNRVHKRARCTIERAFGQLKKRFNCLNCGLRLDIERISSVIVACFALHNLAKRWNEPEFIIEGEDQNDDEVFGIVYPVNDRVLRLLGQNKQMEIVNYLFANRV